MTRPTLILTRPAASAAILADQLSDAAKARLDIVVSPLIDIVPLDVAVDLTGFAGAIFTSAQGVALAPEGAGRPAFCVGEKTTQAASRRGWQALMAGTDAQALVARLLSQPMLGPLLHLGGVHRRGDIAENLRANGIRAETLALYDQRLLPLSDAAKAALASEKPTILPLFSPRTAAHLAAQVDQLCAVTVIAMSPAVAAPLAPLEMKSVLILPTPSAREMRYSIEKLAMRNSLA